VKDSRKTTLFSSADNKPTTSDSTYNVIPRDNKSTITKTGSKIVQDTYNAFPKTTTDPVPQKETRPTLARTSSKIAPDSTYNVIPKTTTDPAPQKDNKATLSKSVPAPESTYNVIPKMDTTPKDSKVPVTKTESRPPLTQDSTYNVIPKTTPPEKKATPEKPKDNYNAIPPMNPRATRIIDQPVVKQPVQDTTYNVIPKTEIKDNRKATLSKPSISNSDLHKALSTDRIATIPQPIQESNYTFIPKDKTTLTRNSAILPKKALPKSLYAEIPKTVLEENLPPPPKEEVIPEYVPDYSETEGYYDETGQFVYYPYENEQNYDDRSLENTALVTNDDPNYQHFNYETYSDQDLISSLNQDFYNYQNTNDEEYQ